MHDPGESEAEDTGRQGGHRSTALRNRLRRVVGGAAAKDWLAAAGKLAGKLHNNIRRDCRGGYQ